jgi:hypothetical protein
MAIRFLARLAKVAGPNDTSATKRAIGRTIRAIGTPEQIKAHGAWLGDFLLALDESRGMR